MLKEIDPTHRKVIHDYAKRLFDKILADQNARYGDLTEDEIEDEKEIFSVGGMVF